MLIGWLYFSDALRHRAGVQRVLPELVGWEGGRRRLGLARHSSKEQPLLWIFSSPESSPLYDQTGMSTKRRRENRTFSFLLEKEEEGEEDDASGGYDHEMTLNELVIT